MPSSAQTLSPEIPSPSSFAALTAHILEGMRAALILCAIVALVASNFSRQSGRALPFSRRVPTEQPASTVPT